MTKEEAVKLIARINVLQEEIWDAHRRNDGLAEADGRGEWYRIGVALRMGGWKMVKKIIRNEEGRKTGCVWSVRQPRQRNNHAEDLAYTNVRPTGAKCRRGDCTTRCISYCLGVNEKGYLKIRNAQDKYAKEHGCKYNSYYSWDAVLKQKGWVRVALPKKTVRWNVAKVMSGTKHPVATSSSGHVCPVHKGKVIDMWNSQNGRVDYVVVHPEDVAKVRSLLKFI